LWYDDRKNKPTRQEDISSHSFVRARLEVHVFRRKIVLTPADGDHIQRTPTYQTPCVTHHHHYLIPTYVPTYVVDSSALEFGS
jgi:hypothetical protein